MNLIFFDTDQRNHLLPLAYTRPVCDFRVGILTIREKWERRLGLQSTTKTVDYLAGLFPFAPDTTRESTWINGSVCPNDELVSRVKKLKPGQSLVCGDQLIAFNSGLSADIATKIDPAQQSETAPGFTQLRQLTDIFTRNGVELQLDFELLTLGRSSATLSATSQVIGPRSRVFIEEGARVECAIFNTESGPVYIGRDALIMEGCLIRGPFALGEGAVLKMGAKIYGPSTFGPGCKVGGEVNNSVMFANSNKSHDGYLGNSVIGEWCNLGADTNNSNLKNNYGEVSLWNYALQRQQPTGLQFCGLIMGDHAKSGINTMFNTGTVVGVCANVFGAGFPPNFIPDFSWGAAEGFDTYRLEKALETIGRVYERRNRRLEAAEEALLEHLFAATHVFRTRAAAFDPL